MQRRRCPRVAYLLSSVAISLNLAVRPVPTEVIAVMATTAIRAAIRPYSIAVAPDSSLAKRANRFFMGELLLHHGLTAAFALNGFGQRQDRHYPEAVAF